MPRATSCLARASTRANDKQRAMTATRVNYLRGLFRLWVILAALWIGGVALVSGPGVYREFQKAAAIEAAKAATITDATKGATVSRLCEIRRGHRRQRRAYVQHRGQSRSIR